MNAMNIAKEIYCVRNEQRKMERKREKEICAQNVTIFRRLHNKLRKTKGLRELHCECFGVCVKNIHSTHTHTQDLYRNFHINHLWC